MRVITICPLCEKEGLLEPYWVKRKLSPIFIHLVMYRCKGCGLLMSNPVADQRDLNAFYSTCYSIKLPKYLDTSLPDPRRNIEPRWERYYKTLLQSFKGGTVLDLGCGVGYFLDYFKNDFDVYGIEKSSEALEAARKKGLINVKQGDIENEDIGENKFDIILFWHVIEHLLDFNSMFKKIHKALKKDGVLILGTDNYLTFQNAMKRWIRFIGFKIPEMYSASAHTFMFTPESMNLALSKAGFDVVHCKTYNPRSLNDNPFFGGCLLDVMAKKQ